MAVEICLALRAEGIQHPKVEVAVEAGVVSFLEVVAGWHAGVAVVVAAESEYCTTLIWVTHLIGWLGIRFGVAREVIDGFRVARKVIIS